jgi:hypothetical protein
VRAVGDGGLGSSSLSWLFDGNLWSHAIDVGPGWLLNVALFAPSGLFVALATRRHLWTLLGLVRLSLVIECVQSFGLLGAPDPADLVANSLGAAVGVGAAALVVLLAGGSVGRADGRRGRTAILLIATTAVAVLGIGWLGLLAGAESRQEALANDLRRAFAGTTATDIATNIATDSGFTELLAATSTRPGYLGRVGDTSMFEARYSIEFFGLDRCVFSRWMTTGVALRNGSGDTCTVFREHAPET